MAVDIQPPYFDNGPAYWFGGGISTTPPVSPFQMASWTMRKSLDLETIIFYENGCLSDGYNDCTLACHDQVLVWNNTETLINCLSYPPIVGLLDVDNLTQHGIMAAEKFNITSITDSNIIQTAISGCLNDFCTSLSHQYQWNCGNDVDFPGFTRDQPWSLPDFCGDEPWTISSDLGGIGVSIHLPFNTLERELIRHRFYLPTCFRSLSPP